MAIIAAALALLAAPVHASAMDSSRWMIEKCAAYFETGDRAVFDNGWPDGELVAFPGGGVCNGDPACESHVMTFIGSGLTGQGAVTVRDFTGAVVGDDIEAGACIAALGVWLPQPGWETASAEWLKQTLDEGRLRAVDDTLFEGCAWNGKVWTLETAPVMLPYFAARLEVDAPVCAAATS